MQGYLTLSLLAPTSVEILIASIEARQFVNYGLEKVRVRSSVRAGSQIRNRIEEIMDLEDKGKCRWPLTMENSVEIDSSE